MAMCAHMKSYRNIFTSVCCKGIQQIKTVEKLNQTFLNNVY